MICRSKNYKLMASKSSLKFNHVLLSGMLTLIAATALAGGIITPWAKAILAIGLLVLLVLLVVKGLRERHLMITIPALTWPLLAAIGLGIIQSLAWIDKAGIRQSLSLDVEATRETLFIFVLMLIWLLLSAALFRTTESRRALTNFLVIYGLILAFSALVLSLAWKQNINWLRPVEGGSPFGPFVNRNHFAGYMELLLPIPVALLVTHRRTLEHRVFYVFAAVMIGVALCLSLSRGGIISMCAQLIFLVSLNSQMRISKQQPESKIRLFRWASVTAIFLLIVAGIIAMGAEPIIFRLAGSDFETDRGAIWADSWRVFRAHPLIGAGLGTFETSFPMHAYDKGFDIAAESHNDYLQVLADTGLVGFGILLWFLIVLVRVISQCIKFSALHSAALALGSATGLFGLLVHSLFDFNLQLPSHALLFLLYGAVCSNIALDVKQMAKASVPKEIVTNARHTTPILN